MAGLRIGQKVDRVVRFLLGLRDRRIAGRLAHHGFAQRDLDEGWQLMRTAVGERLGVTPVAAPNPAALEKLDDWENRWFPIAEATLTHHHPKVRDELFLNLSQTEGPELVISVGTFLKRLGKLDQGSDEHKSARELLIRRGLTTEVLREANSLIETVGTVESPPPEDAENILRAREEAEANLWAWYLEWSTIARTAISDGRLLRRLGYGNDRRDEPEGRSEPATDEPTPVAPI